MTDALQRALTYIPDGSCTLSKRPAAWPSGGPRIASTGDGPYLYGTDGHKYIDLMCALGALTVGHNHPHVYQAVERQLRRGAIFSLPSALEGAVAERLCRIIPCAEQVKFVKTGSEACSAAVRIARLATGRDKILSSATSYHGWHDQMIAAKPSHPGVPRWNEQGIGLFDYNNIDQAEGLIQMVKPAAVILEPVQGVPPAQGFLKKLVAIAHAYGALVIFDEMLCGGRLAVAGAQEYYEVTPDLATFGKAFGGGLPLAFVCGSRDLMQHAWPISGTFSGDALALAACDAMLDLYGRSEPQQNVVSLLWSNGSLLKDALLAEAKQQDLALVVEGHSPRFWISFSDTVDRRLAMSVFVQQCAKRGVLVHPAVFFASAALSHTDVCQAAVALREALALVAVGIRNDTVPNAPAGLRSLLVGDCYQDSVR